MNFGNLLLFIEQAACVWVHIEMKIRVNECGRRQVDIVLLAFLGFLRILVLNIATGRGALRPVEEITPITPAFAAHQEAVA